MGGLIQRENWRGGGDLGLGQAVSGPSIPITADNQKLSSHCGDEGLDWRLVSSHSGVTHVSANPKQEEAVPHLPKSHQVMTRGKQYHSGA